MLKTYYQLAKPGIIYGNLLVSIGGFLLASQGRVDFGLMAATLLGIALIIGSACVVNNYTDRGIDSKMARTKNRALVTGEIGVVLGLLYATLLGVAGFALLWWWTNGLTVILGATAYFSYVAAYGYAKRRSVYGTHIGAIPGALPPVAAYTAVTGQLDTAAVLLFLVMVIWQMPHFFAIGIFRRDDYAAADLPVLPVSKGVDAAKKQIAAYIVLFCIAVSLPTLFGITGYSYLFAMLGLGGYWLWLAIKDYSQPAKTISWARRVFYFSLVVLFGFSVMISLDNLLI